MTNIPKNQTVIYKLLHEETGLYWAGHFSTEKNIFNDTGIHFSNKNTAINQSQLYEAKRQISPQLNLPPIIIAFFQVSYTEIERKGFSASEEDMIIAKFSLQYGKDSPMAIFARNLRKQQILREYKYLIVYIKNSPDFSAIDGGIISKCGRLFAVKTDADLLYARMLLDANYRVTYSMSSGMKIHDGRYA